MQFDHPELVGLLKKAYSAEKAASFAYQGYAASLKDKIDIAAINQIEKDYLKQYLKE